MTTPNTQDSATKPQEAAAKPESKIMQQHRIMTSFGKKNPKQQEDLGRFGRHD